MTDASGPKAETMKNLGDKVADLQRSVDYWKEMATTNGTNGREWKAIAEENANQLKEAIAQERRARDASAIAKAEAAELRGYIRRVNELDPPERRILETVHSAEQTIIDKMHGRY